ncbi:MAG: metallophosphatase [Bacteroidota bacterium]
MNRRAFVRKFGTGTLLLGASAWPWEALAARGEIQQLTILHTNDVHSRMEPFPMDGGRHQGMGGAARRAALIKQIRAEAEQVLLLDAGDIFQGTPYFNFFGGELEMKLMSEMGYDAATIGNHDFDAGLEGLHRQLPHTQFPLINANYDFSDTVMNGQTTPYQVFKKGGIKVGITGVGIELAGLVPKDKYGRTRYTDPIAAANHKAAILKGDYGCDYVICLSHLGFRYDSPQRVSDHTLAQQSQGIDLILGGHTHTFLDAPVRVINAEGEAVLIHQVGWAGLRLGRIDVYFEKRRQRKAARGQSLPVGASD